MFAISAMVVEASRFASSENKHISV